MPAKCHHLDRLAARFEVFEDVQVIVGTRRANGEQEYGGVRIHLKLLPDERSPRLRLLCLVIELREQHESADPCLVLGHTQCKSGIDGLIHGADE